MIDFNLGNMIPCVIMDAHLPLKLVIPVKLIKELLKVATDIFKQNSLSSFISMGILSLKVNSSIGGFCSLLGLVSCL